MMTGSTVTANMATGNGGGVATSNKSSLVMVDCNIGHGRDVKGNAAAKGGGIALEDSSLMMRRSIIAENSAEEVAPKGCAHQGAWIKTALILYAWVFWRRADLGGLIDLAQLVA